MSSELSPYAIHGILYFVESSRKVKPRTSPAQRASANVNEKWRYVYAQYFTIKRPPPMDYLRSPEIELFLREDLDNEAMQTVFAHGKPLVFDQDLPRLLVPKIIEVRKCDAPVHSHSTLLLVFLEERQK